MGIQLTPEDEKKKLIACLHAHGIRLQHASGCILSELGWIVRYETAYRDDADGFKVRKTDIWAERTLNQIRAVIVAECKFLKNPSIILHDDRVAAEPPFNGFVIHGFHDFIENDIQREKKHHWMTDMPYQLHVSAGTKDDKEDQLAEALHQCLKPVNSAHSNHIPTIFYPMVIFSGANIYAATTNILTRGQITADNLTKTVSRKMMQVSYFSPDRAIRSPMIRNIDLVQENELENFIANTVNKELEDYAVPRGCSQ